MTMIKKRMIQLCLSVVVFSMAIRGRDEDKPQERGVLL